MSRIWFKKTPLCLALTLFALPAVADSIFSGVINFGREILDETRKLAPGVQNDRRNETPADTRAALQDGRDRPAIEAPSNDQYNQHQNGNYQSEKAQPSYNQNSNAGSNIQLAPPVNGQPTGSNLNYTYGEGQRSNRSQAAPSNHSNSNVNSNVNSNANSDYNSNNNAGYNSGADQGASQDGNANFGWQEENNLQ